MKWEEPTGKVAEPVGTIAPGVSAGAQRSCWRMQREKYSAGAGCLKNFRGVLPT